MGVSVLPEGLADPPAEKSPQNSQAPSASQHAYFLGLPRLTIESSMLAYRSKLCIRCHRPQTAKLQQGSGGFWERGGT